ncbi:50S ribosomal protein L31 [Brumicola nitratireducens]|jgi:large subunit ribosomal protein L31|uniref:Large ribosomal subunit protein bL31 n=1 Tax=Glaciecola nitratireducens (strain JCM 12485 / KCTC 12276 / FR1064) TaxID=1085623 RepID=G4QMR9_GLANF|nr:50S ribosomal protein L31 [Glaciecola nitratireducens]AEP31002.1 50S ribosomal subunit protein L31 [Glaciecola nitratireducens FR1064]|tara:strand:- start:317 stop:529 length:213 start_codon:yes stop_codon:yes gene_type:complete
MKDGIHPKYNEIKATCSCGNVMDIRSTLDKDINLDVCSSCHPFYTGKQRNVDTGGRVDKFKKRFGGIKAK